jgi:hypothetical protein
MKKRRIISGGAPGRSGDYFAQLSQAKNTAGGLISYLDNS